MPDTPASASNDRPVVVIEGLRLVVENRVLLELDRWTLGAGERALVVGPSGSGKTTLLHVLAGLRKPEAGRVYVVGRDLSASSEADRDVFRGRLIGYIFQTLHLVGALSVLDNLRLAAFLARNPVPDERLLDLLASVGLADRARARPFELSQGEAQRVAIARALVNAPQLVLADEPTSALDDRNAELVLELLLRTTARERAALIVATHDKRLLPFFDRRLELGSAR